jgi:hypothetical protein
MISIFDNVQKSDLTDKQKQAIEILEISIPTDLKIFKEKVINSKILAQMSFYRLINQKSKQFAVSTNQFSKQQLITRYF